MFFYKLEKIYFFIFCENYFEGVMRIISGQFRGKKLSKFNDKLFGKSMRPTLDRIKESYFNSIIHNKLVDFKGLRVLDLFAGTGANGLEAISRGASFVFFIDNNSNSIQLIKENVNILGIKERIKILKKDITKLENNSFNFCFDMVFMDPPYNDCLINVTISSIIKGNWIKKNTIIVIEGNKEMLIPENFVLERILNFKKIKVLIIRYLG